MSLKALLRAGKELLKAKKPSATPATGQQQRQVTYEPKPSQAQAKELVTHGPNTCLLYTSDAADE